MRLTLLRILKHGVPTAIFLAVMGYVLAEAAGMWLASQPAPGEVRSRADAPAFQAEPAVGADPEMLRTLRYQLPLRMAAWGVGLVVIVELFLGLIRRAKPRSAVPPSDAEVEQLLNQLLEQSEAAKAACPPAAGPQNTPGPN
jgi:hypothetical protein